MTNATDTRYNGWANYETWNAALWLQNDEAMYEQAVQFVLSCRMLDVPVEYARFHNSLAIMFRSPMTPDGVNWSNPAIDHAEMDQMLNELVD